MVEDERREVELLAVLLVGAREDKPIDIPYPEAGVLQRCRDDVDGKLVLEVLEL